MKYPSRRIHPLIAFFVVAFGLPWTGWAIMILKHVPVSPSVPLELILFLNFCSVGGFVACYYETGWTGVKDLARRCLLYRAPGKWWAYALCLMLLLDGVATIVYRVANGHVISINLFEPVREWWLLFNFFFGFFLGPLGEEIGWRGFLLPYLLKKYSALTSSLIVGFISVLWHFPSAAAVGGPYYFHSLDGVLLFTASGISMSILMTVLFLHTRSVLLAIVFHWSTMPSVTIAKIIFPGSEPPDWARATVLIIFTLILVIGFPKRLFGLESTITAKNLPIFL